MSYPCLECDAELEDFSAAMEHWDERGHEIGAWRSHERG